MAIRDIIVIGASAGGIEALRVLVGMLPKDFPASIFVVLHISPASPGVLPDILSRAGELQAVSPRDWQTIEPGRIYVAPPDHHLLLEPTGDVRVTRGPKENRFRPAVDPLFRSAARAFGQRVIGIILTGGLDDGTAGLWAVKQRGGVAVVQDPVDADEPSMPLSALRYVEVDYCLPLADIASLLVRLTAEPADKEGGSPMPEELDIEVGIALEDRAHEAGVLKLGEMSPFTCPECHGTLLQMRDENPLRFRCHTGHAFSINSLLAELTESVEDTMWTAVRSIEESVMLMRHMAHHLLDRNDREAAEALLEKAQQAKQRAESVRQVLIHHEKFSEADLEHAEQA